MCTCKYYNKYYSMSILYYNTVPHFYATNRIYFNRKCIILYKNSVTDTDSGMYRGFYMRDVDVNIKANDFITS